MSIFLFPGKKRFTMFSTAYKEGRITNVSVILKQSRQGNYGSKQ